MHPWALRVLACPRCTGRLRLGKLRQPEDVLECGACGVYPVLGGIPILVPDPAGYCATYYDAILSSLAEDGKAGRKSVELVQLFAGGSRARSPLAFGDDWTDHDHVGGPPPLPPRGAIGDRYAAFVTHALASDTRAFIVDALEPLRPSVGAELGCGAGRLTRDLTPIKHLVIADLSLRATLTARRTRSRASSVAIVADAEALPFQNGSLNVCIAQNLVDLLHAPDAFVSAARAAMAPKGTLIVTTPDPSLGTEHDDELLTLLRKAGFRQKRVDPSVPFLHLHDSRHHQVKFALGVIAERR